MLEAWPNKEALNRGKSAGKNAAYITARNIPLSITDNNGVGKCSTAAE
jgi:hypothetical protein